MKNKVKIISFILLLITCSCIFSGCNFFKPQNKEFQILTSSMEPTFMIGDMVEVEEKDLNVLKVGDIIAFYAPKKSGYIDSEGNSLVIVHRIVRIIYAKNTNGIMVRYFVCHGDNAGALFYAKVKELGTGDYSYNPVSKEYQLNSNGDYVVKLMNDTDIIANEYTVMQINSLNQSTIQYVDDSLVIGIARKIQNKDNEVL